VLLPLVLALLVLVGYAAEQMTRPYQLGETLPISLDPVNLPYYMLRTTLRCVWPWSGGGTAICLRMTTTRRDTPAGG
jgi:hypothetical protein